MEVFYSPQWFELFEQNMCDRQLDECTEMFALWPCCFHRQYTGGKKYIQKEMKKKKKKKITLFLTNQKIKV